MGIVNVLKPKVLKGSKKSKSGLKQSTCRQHSAALRKSCNWPPASSLMERLTLQTALNINWIASHFYYISLSHFMFQNFRASRNLVRWMRGLYNLADRMTTIRMFIV